MKLARAGTKAEKLLVLLGLLVLCLAAALPLFAAPMGVPSTTFTSWGALQGSTGLELRDEINRPVSRADVEREFRAGSVEMLRQSVAFSKVGALRALLDALDTPGLIRATLRPISRPARLQELAAFLSRDVRLRAPVLAGAPAPEAGQQILNSSVSPTYHRILTIALRC